MLEVEERVNHLDELMAQLIQTVDQTSREMREFKTEMRQAHDRFEQEMRQADERSKREMQEFKAEMRKSKRDMDKKWGELSNKLGTMAEDLVAPSIPRILRQVTGCTLEIEYSAVRVRKSKPKNQEFDVVAVCENYVFINETKSTLRSEYINDFNDKMQNIHDYFPEFNEKKFIGVIASLYVEENLVRQGEKLGLVVLGFGEELMDVLNRPGFVPKLF